MISKYDIIFLLKAPLVNGFGFAFAKSIN